MRTKPQTIRCPFCEKKIPSKRENKLKEIGITVISDYKDCIYPDEYFYNSAWHMNQKGADARSENVANDLKKQLGK